MLVVSMNTKRQRRPNVRLGDIGDVSAAFACGFNQGATTREKLGHKRWKNDFVNSSEIEWNQVYGFSEKKDSEMTISDPGVSPRNSADSQQNRENKNPNSSRAIEFTSLDRTVKAKSALDFGNITRKCRVMKRRGQSWRGSKGFFGSAWGSKLSPEFSGQDRKENNGKEFEGYTFNVCDEYDNGDGFKDMSDRDTPATSKEGYEYDAYGYNNDLHPRSDFGNYLNEDACFEENDGTKSGGMWDEMRSEGGDTNCVRTWLEELGFGKYADTFEMHEVDEEALLLLTLEDLKEMGAMNIMFLLVKILCFSWILEVAATVSYDNKAILINGKRRILISGSIHYPRSTPEMWPDLIQKAKNGGLDVIQTYVFWNGHEPSPGKYYFEGRYDLVKFIKLVQKAGLYVHLRIGPYVCAEWNFGGFPIWLKYVPGMEFRTDNEPFKATMQKFTEKIVNMIKAENLFEPQGGPIILAQIENEYELVEYGLGNAGKAYAKWSANMAVGLKTEVPWVMCKQRDALDPIINSCNGFYCENFLPNRNNKPKMWTEAWSGWLLKFGGPAPYRPAEDLAFAVTRFIQNRGSYINYYMFHGGTNFGRTAGGPFIATSYDYDAPVDEYGLTREPKYSHLRDLHAAIRLSEPALVSANPVRTSLGKNQEAHVFETKSGACAAFLTNYDPQYFANVTFRKRRYGLPPWSTSILPHCQEETFNTAKVKAASLNVKMETVNKFSWQSYTEGVPSTHDKNSFVAHGLLEQLNVTRDVSDYLWYTTDVSIRAEEEFLKNGKFPILKVSSAGHALQVFINGQLSGTAYGSIANPKLSFSGKVTLKAGINKISLLSVAVGLPNVGLHFEKWNTGVLGPVTLEGLSGNTWDLSRWKWSYKTGLDGEMLSLYSFTGSSSVKWAKGSALPKRQALTWYKTTFDAPEGKDPVALDMSSMGKGQIWINGQSIGRHWPARKASGGCSRCSYTGTFHENKCLRGCGEATQKWYHVPRSWLQPKGNLLVVFEEQGGDPTGISLVRRTAQNK